MQKEGKLIVFSAPSGSGKTTIVHHLLAQPELNLDFSISATSRPLRGTEIDGKDYYFISAKKFKKHIEKDHFIEWEEVYESISYGTLKSEIERIFGLCVQQHVHALAFDVTKKPLLLVYAATFEIAIEETGDDTVLVVVDLVLVEVLVLVDQAL